jgi:polyisoprenoid-binding protein YceI
MKTLFPSAALIIAGLLSAAGAQAEVVTYSIDPTHTFVTFEASHFNTSTLRGRFDKKSGSVMIDKAAKKGEADITIELTSVSTGVAPLDKHLMSKDFFNAEQNKTAVFKSKEITFDGDKVSGLAGTLSMNGKDNPVMLKAGRFNCYDNPMLKREVCGGDFEATIQRSQWGIVYGLPGIPDSIRLLIQIEAIRQ